MVPTVGRIVHYVVPVTSRGNNNGAAIAPAVITRVWSDSCVNLQVLHDCGPIEVVTSVVLEPNDLTLERHWHWPPMVESPRPAPQAPPVQG